VTDRYLNRFMNKTVAVSGNNCWQWLGSINPLGYAQFYNGKTMVRAHRFIYEAIVSAIPKPLTIDHLCRNRACVNPNHMEIVSSRENTLRGDGLAAKLFRQTHCCRDHLLSGENLLIRFDGSRKCRKCGALRSHNYRQKTLQAKNRRR